METIFDDRSMILRTNDSNLLIVADIHLGYEIELAEKTGAVFPLQHERMLERLASLVDTYHIDVIHIIGDVKHTISADSHYNWEIIPKFITQLSKMATINIVPGNHDGDLAALLPRDVTISDVHGLLLDGTEPKIGILHGHAWPADELLEAAMLVVGHNHPSVRRLKNASSPEIDRIDRYRSANVVPVVIRSTLNPNCVQWNRDQLEMDSEDVIIATLPSFNELITGIHINRPGARFLGPFFTNECADLSSSEVYSVDGIFLGIVETLQHQFTATK
jgi:putative SbcD/Mre11-related phosphoesterase